MLLGIYCLCTLYYLAPTRFIYLCEVQLRRMEELPRTNHPPIDIFAPITAMNQREKNQNGGGWLSCSNTFKWILHRWVAS